LGFASRHWILVNVACFSLTIGTAEADPDFR